jgi:Mn2+/Fe2+ NRAMP family transporter
MTRKIENLGQAEKKKAYLFFRIETLIVIFMSFIVNMAVIGSFTGYNTDSISGDNFDFISAGELLKTNLGEGARILYGIGLFCSGMSSTTTGALTGQYVMNGYCKFKMNKKLRIFITRTVALIPCLLIVNYAQLSSANQILNLIQAIQLPFVLIPLARYIRNRKIMGTFTFTGSKFWFILTSGFFLIILNVVNAIKPCIDSGLKDWRFFILVGVWVAYIAFLGYLVLVKLDTCDFVEFTVIFIFFGLTFIFRI